MALAGIGIAACGGSVSVETTTGGEGGGGSSGTGPSTGVGGDEQQAVCAKLCAFGDAFGCDSGGAECVPACVDGFAAIPDECKDEYADLLSCASASIPQSGCDVIQQCTSEAFAFGACIGGTGPGPGPGPGCDGGDCVGSETACSCNGFCNGQAREVDCKAQGDQYACTCLLDGEQVGTCNEPLDLGGSCDLQIGCCAAFF